MTDISRKITKKSLAAKKKAAIKTVKLQAKEKIHQIKLEYASDPERLKIQEQEKAQRKENRLRRANARLAYNERQPRPYSLGEDIFHSLTHGIGAGLSVAAIVLLLVRAYFSPVNEDFRTTKMLVTGLFGGALFIFFLASTLNHAIFSLGARRIFDLISRNAFLLLIASSYSAFALISQSPVSVAGVLTACLCSMIVSTVFSKRFSSLLILLCLVLGWGLVGSVCRWNFSSVSPRLYLASGVIFSISVIFHAMRTYKWSHGVFHLLVLAASIVCFFSIYYLL